MFVLKHIKKHHTHINNINILIFTTGVFKTNYWHQTFVMCFVLTFMSI